MFHQENGKFLANHLIVLSYLSLAYDHSRSRASTAEVFKERFKYQIWKYLNIKLIKGSVSERRINGGGAKIVMDEK